MAESPGQKEHMFASAKDLELPARQVRIKRWRVISADEHFASEAGGSSVPMSTSPARQ